MCIFDHNHKHYWGFHTHSNIGRFQNWFRSNRPCLHHVSSLSISSAHILLETSFWSLFGTQRPHSRGRIGIWNMMVLLLGRWDIRFGNPGALACTKRRICDGMAVDMIQSSYLSRYSNRSQLLHSTCHQTSRELFRSQLSSQRRLYPITWRSVDLP